MFSFYDKVISFAKSNPPIVGPGIFYSPSKEESLLGRKRALPEDFNRADWYRGTRKKSRHEESTLQEISSCFNRCQSVADIFLITKGREKELKKFRSSLRQIKANLKSKLDEDENLHSEIRAEIEQNLAEIRRICGLCKFALNENKGMEGLKDLDKTAILDGILYLGNRETTLDDEVIDRDNY